uniref:Recep_L_domain domain-containing protein n=1 Tax=Caenorhabditis tropicalis TaxID=1561998 RepID=A0A1I7V1T8_9PELO
MLRFLLFGCFLTIGLKCDNQTEPLIDDEYPEYNDPRCLSGCFFESNILQVSTMKIFPTNCSTVCAPYSLHISIETDLNEKQLTNILKNMKHLIGSLYVFRSKFTSAKFLANLETIDCYNIGTLTISLNPKMIEVGMTSLSNVSCRVDISANGLYRLNMPKMKLVQSPYANYSTLDLEFMSNSDDFCVTVEEMSNFMESREVVLDRFGRTTGKYCELSNTTNLPQKTCDIGKVSLENLDSGCVNLRGDLLIEEGDEEHVHKLETLETLFGNLHITKTNLTNTNFLGKLKNVMSITEDQPTILVDFNELLTNVSFPSLNRILSTVHVSIQFNNNSKELLQNPSFCYNILNSLNNQTTYRTRFDGKVCEDVEKSIVKDDKSKGSAFSNGLWVLMILTLVFV